MQAGSALLFALGCIKTIRQIEEDNKEKCRKQKRLEKREGKRAASRIEKRVEGREEPQGRGERTGVGLAGWLCSCVRTSCGKTTKQIEKDNKEKYRKYKRREEGSKQKRKEGRGQGRTSRDRAFGGRACRLALLLCSQ